MTEKEWLECADPQKMLENLRGRWSDRKLRLFGCACLGLRPWREDARLQSVVRIAEKYADTEVGDKSLDNELSEARRLGDEVIPDNRGLDRTPPMRHALYLATAFSAALMWHTGFASGRPFEDGLRPGHRAACCDLLRCVMGNPFRPRAGDMFADGVDPPDIRAIPTSVLSWNDGTVRRIAQGIYDERAFDRLPILADALLDAGCTDEELITHCRESGPHFRGCWPVDAILGKT